RRRGPRPLAPGALAGRTPGGCAGGRALRAEGVRAPVLPGHPVPGGAGDAPVKPRRPYLLRAMHEWISESDCTPHIVVDAGVRGVEVPRQYVRDGKIVLNLSLGATAHLQLGNDEITFSGRFGGTPMNVRI